MANKRPTHKLVAQFKRGEHELQTEVGAVWPHDKGGGFSIVLRPGIALYSSEEVRITAFTIDYDREGKDRDRDRRDDRNDRSSRRDDDRGGR